MECHLTNQKGTSVENKKFWRLSLLLSNGASIGGKISEKTAGFGLGLFISNKIAEQLANLKREKGGGI